ncbi:MAG: hypothetical protein ACRCVT_13750 [Leadbetterella sp.]
MNFVDLKPLEEVIPETNIIVFSPHYDDVLFFIGGWLLGMKEKGLLDTRKIHVKVCFSRSNYQCGDGKKNLNPDLERIKMASGKRLIEDMDCLNEVIGRFNYVYELLDEEEAFVRGVNYASSEMEFPYGNYSNFTNKDREILTRMKDRIRFVATQSDTAIIFPLSYKDHVDHFICRESALVVAEEMGQNRRAVFYFAEDKPYGGLATAQEVEDVEKIILDKKLTPYLYTYDPEEVINLAFKHYVSQVEEVYATGIRNRANWWKIQCASSQYVDRILKL